MRRGVQLLVLPALPAQQLSVRDSPGHASWPGTSVGYRAAALPCWSHLQLSTPAAFLAAIPKGQMESAWRTWPAPLVLQLHVAAQVAPMLHLADKLQERITAVSNSCVMALSLLGVQMHLAAVEGSRDETYGGPG